MSRQAYYVSTPRWTCCVEIVDGRIVETAPILRATWRGKAATQFFRSMRAWYSDRVRWVRLPA